MKGEPDSVARSLLMAQSPRLRSGEFVVAPDEPAVDFAVRIAGDLDKTVLAIQGPPGSGKTFTGARDDLRADRQGKKVGVTANSHKVIRNLLDAVGKADKKAAVRRDARHRQGDDDEEDARTPRV